MSWTTSETANCRISATDEAYASMDADSVTNTDSTTHSDVESFACDASYHRYVACVDPSDNETAARTDISFSIDTGAPPDPSTVGSSTGGGSSGGSM